MSLFLANSGAIAIPSGGGGGGGADSDATAFFTATGISDPTIQSATNQLVLDLKSYGIWTKCPAIYPYVGGTAATHKYNLKDPRDLDAAFRLTFGGSWTHNANGITNGGGYPNYADTKLVASTTLTFRDTHLSIYCRNNTNAGRDLGAHKSDNLATLALAARTSGNTFAVMGRTTVGDDTITVANSDSSGFYIATRRSSTSFETYKNGTSTFTDTTADGGSLPALPIYIGDSSYTGFANGMGDTSARNYAFASIGAALSDTEAANFYTAVQAFQTTLGRQV